MTLNLYYFLFQLNVFTDGSDGILERYLQSIFEVENNTSDRFCFCMANIGKLSAEKFSLLFSRKYRIFASSQKYCVSLLDSTQVNNFELLTGTLLRKKKILLGYWENLIVFWKLQFQKKFNQRMFNPYHFYPSWQPTFIYFPNFVSNLAPVSFSSVEYNVTVVGNESRFDENDQLLDKKDQFKRVESTQVPPIEPNTNSTKIPKQSKLKQKSLSEITEVSVRKPKVQKSLTPRRKSSSKLLFDVEWKNQNRNIIPNIMNQMFSFLQKRHKSEHLITKIFAKYDHSASYTIPKFYCYMKRMKSSMGHYINESELESIIKIQQPQFSIYPLEQQLFYLKMSRIVIDYFFRSQSILVSLTSNRMSEKKRKAHLIARRALLQRVQQLFTETAC